MAVGEFGGTTPTMVDFDQARVVILPIPFDRTTSYVPGTRTGPHEILVASSHMELWDEETQTDVHSIGICTLPEISAFEAMPEPATATGSTSRPYFSKIFASLVK
jgi:agmatinase